MSLAERATLALGGDWRDDHGAVRAPGAAHADRSIILVGSPRDDDVVVICRDAQGVQGSWAEIREKIRELGIDLPYHEDREWRQTEGLRSFPVGFGKIGDHILSLIDLSSWSLEPPSRRWMLDDWIPARQATYLTGLGGSGKSLLAQQLCTCLALGVPFLGLPTRQTPALYVTCEDDAEELHRRQATICAALGVPISELPGRLHLSSLSGELGNELASFDAAGRMNPAKAYHRLRAAVAATGAHFVGLDNVAQLFAGNENIRHEVASFCGLLTQLAQQIDGAVLFIGHPNKAGDSFSGSTAWENQVRSRIFMETPKAASGEVRDPDRRVIRRVKANYAPTGEELECRWYRWAYVRDADLSAEVHAELAGTVRATVENAAFLKCLDKARAERRAASSRKSAPNYAPRLFASMPVGSGFREFQFEEAMNRLLHLGVILDDQQLWRRENRSWKTGLGRAPEVAPNVHQAGAPKRTRGQNKAPAPESTKGAAPDPLYTSYIQGEAPSGDASPWPTDDEELWRP